MSKVKPTINSKVKHIIDKYPTELDLNARNGLTKYSQDIYELYLKVLCRMIVMNIICLNSFLSE